MTRIGPLIFSAAASIGAIGLYLWMDLRDDHLAMRLEAATPAQPTPLAEQLTVPPPRASDAEAPDGGGVATEVPIHEEEPPPLPATMFPALTEQVAANWEDTQRRRTYGDLLKLMRLPKADEQRFLALLASRYVGETEADEQAGREINLALQGLLKGHWPQFVAYEQEMEERIYVMHCDEVMAARDAGLAPEQRRQLVTMMAQVRRNLGEQPTDQPDAWMRTERAFQANILSNAAALLKPVQLEAFREALQQQLEASQVVTELVPGAAPVIPAPPISGR